jgi:arginine exporter protein ArgO
LKTTDEKIKLRNHWFKIILISLFAMVLMFKIAVTRFTFHFSDMLAFILAIFAIGICSMFYVKVNEALQAFSAAGKSLLPFSNKNNKVTEEIKEQEVQKEETILDESERNGLERQLLTQQEQVKRMKQVQKEITNRLVAEDLHEEDKRDYIEYLLQKEKEIMLTKQEIVRITSLLEPAEETSDEEVHEHDEEFEEYQDEHSVQTATAKDIVQLLGKEFVLNATLEQFNHKMREIQHSITIETAKHLKEEGLIDPYFNVTRKGLKEFRRAAKKFSYEDGVKFLSKVVQRGNR